MNYKSYICGSCMYKDVCLTEPEDFPAHATPICHFCVDGSEYKPRASKPLIGRLRPITMNTGEFTKALKGTLDIFDLDVASLYPSGPMIMSINTPIKKVIFNNPATIVMWMDGSKTVVKCGADDIYDPEKGLAMAIAKKALGNKGSYFNEFKKWLPKEETSEETESFYTDGKPGAGE